MLKAVLTLQRKVRQRIKWKKLIEEEDVQLLPEFIVNANQYRPKVIHLIKLIIYLTVDINMFEIP